jgi:hypothetical protein
MIDEQLQQYEKMWTTDMHRYGLVELDPDQPQCCVVMDLETGGLVVIDDAAEVVTAVTSRMRSAGVRIITRRAEAKRNQG